MVRPKRVKGSGYVSDSFDPVEGMYQGELVPLPPSTRKRYESFLGITKNEFDDRVFDFLGNVDEIRSRENNWLADTLTIIESAYRGYMIGDEEISAYMRALLSIAESPSHFAEIARSSARFPIQTGGNGG